MGYTESAWFFKSDGKAEKMDIPKLKENIETAFSTSSFIWLHLDFTKSLSAEMMHLLRLSPAIKDTLLSQTTRPRFENVDDNSYLLVLRGVNLIDPDHPHDMISLRCYASKDILITTGHRQLKTILEISDAIENGEKTFTNPHHICAEIVKKLAEKMAPVFAEIEDEVDDFELLNLNQDANSADSGSRKYIKDLRLQTLHLRRYIFPQKEALVQYLDFLNRVFGFGEYYEVKQSIDDHRRYIEDIDLTRERLNLLDQEIVALISERMNNNLYVLSIVSLIFLPLGFLTGLFGINVGGMPMTENDMGFWIVCIICAVLAIIQFIFLVKMGWINWGGKPPLERQDHE